MKKSTEITAIEFSSETQNQLQKLLAPSEIQKISERFDLICGSVMGLGVDVNSAKERSLEFLYLLKNDEARKTIAGCTPFSVITAIATAARKNWSLSGHKPDAYLVPFYEKIKDGNGNAVGSNRVVSLTPSYKGLMHDNPTIKRFEYFIVREGDYVVESCNEYGDLIIKDKKIVSKGGTYGGSDFIAIYGYLVVKNDNGTEAKTALRKMTKEEVEKLRKMNRGQGDKPSDFWRTSYEQMAAVKLFRFLGNFVNGVRFEDAAVYTVSATGQIERDFEYDTVEVEQTPQSELTPQEKADTIANEWKLAIFNILENSTSVDFAPIRKGDTHQNYTYRWGHKHARKVFASFRDNTNNEVEKNLAYDMCKTAIGEMITEKEAEFVATTNPKDPKTAYYELNPAQ